MNQRKYFGTDGIRGPVGQWPISADFMLRLGRGRQRGIQVGSAVYGELAKLCLMLVVPDSTAPKAVEAILQAAKTGHPGDGRIFVSEMKESYTIRTGRSES